jgi:hypothetical protein
MVPEIVNAQNTVCGKDEHLFSHAAIARQSDEAGKINGKVSCNTVYLAVTC